MQGKADVVANQQGAASAVALAVANGEPTAYIVGHNAALKIHTLSTKAQVPYAQASYALPEHFAFLTCAETQCCCEDEHRLLIIINYRRSS